MIMVVLALALGLFAFDKFVLSESREASIAEEARQKGRSEAMVESYGDKSIAVLPFVNMSDDASNEYFSDGISEELLNLLAKIPELRVSAPPRRRNGQQRVTRGEAAAKDLVRLLI